MKPYRFHPVYVYEIHGGRTWGGDSDEFCGFSFVITKDKISIRDFADMFAEAAKLSTVHYGEKFLRNVAKRLCTPEEKGKKREVPRWRTIEFDGYRWSIERFGGSHNESLIFDNGNMLPIDHA
jgi:hypothetical protein